MKFEVRENPYLNGEASSRRLNRSDPFKDSGYRGVFEWKENDEAKQQQRDLIMSFFLAQRAEDAPIRFLGFPGERWSFERQLADEVGLELCQFRAVEWSWGVLEKSVPWMPGRKPLYIEHELTTGVVKGYETSRSVIMHAYANAWFAIRGTDHGGKHMPTLAKHKKLKKKFAQKYKNNTAIWLDFTSNLSANVQETLKWVFTQCDPHTHSVPLAITACYGRDGVKGGLEARHDLIARCINTNKYRSYNPVDQWSYISDTNCAMSTFLGLLVKPFDP